jgi:hypothetical protein
VYANKCVDLIESMCETLRRLLLESVAAGTLSGHVALFPASAASSPRLLMAHIWQTYCKPLLTGFRCVSACATDRIRVLYKTYHHLNRVRQQAEARSGGD